MKPIAACLSDIRSFMKSRIILSAAELDLFTFLDNHPASAADIANARKLDIRSLTRVMDCLVTFDLMEKKHGLYSLTETGKQLSSKHPQSVLASVLHQNRLWDTWSHLTDILHGENTPIDSDKKTSFSEADRKAFIGAMQVVGRETAGKITEAYNAKSFTNLLDIGGGSGVYSIAFLGKYPHLKATLFDLKEVIPITQEYIRSTDLENRINLVEGDYTTDPLPSGCDLALLSAIIHQNSPDQNAALYRNIFRALTPGGALLIRDFIMEEDRLKPASGALFAINMLANTEGGDTYTFNEIKESLVAAGFRNISLVQQGTGMDGLVEAKKPG